MHIEFYRFFDESVNSYAQGPSVAFLHKINLPPGCISLSQSATLTNAGGFAAARSGPFFYCWPVFQGALCVSNQDMGVILADLCIELASATISTANTHYCTDSGRGSSSTISLKRHDPLPTRATNTSLKASVFQHLFLRKIHTFIKKWCGIWRRERHTLRVSLSSPACALIVLQNWRVVPNVRHNYPTEKQIRVKAAFEGENKMAADCFLKELTWPDPLEPSHLLNGWHFICFVPVTTESPKRRSTRSPWYCHK